MLSVEELRDLVQRDQVRTVIVAFTDHCGRLVGKRFEAEVFLESVHEDGTHACDYLLANDMEMVPVSGYRFANWAISTLCLTGAHCVWRVGWRKRRWSCVM